MKKIIGILVAAVYIGQNVGLANAAESNFWASRRQQSTAKTEKPVQLAALPAPGAMSPADLLRQLPQISRPLEALRQPAVADAASGRLPDDISRFVAAVPLQQATVRDVHVAPGSGPMVLLVQDVHLNTEAQSNIAGVLKSVFQDLQNGGRLTPPVLAVEGVEGPFDFRAFRAFADRSVPKNVADAFLAQNRISATSYVGITSTDNRLVVTGVDDEKHYQANVRAYQATRALKPAAAEKISGWKRTLVEQKRAALNPDLQKLDARIVAFESGNGSFGEYVAALSRMAEAKGLTPEHDIARFLQAFAIEKSLNFQDVEAQRGRVVQELIGKLGDAEVKDLLERTVAYRAGRLSYAGYYEGIRALISRHNIDLSKTPAFEKYISYVILADGIKPTPLLAGIRSLENATVAALAKTDEERRLMAVSRRLFHAEKLLDFGLTPDEWAEWRAEKAPFTISASEQPLDLSAFEAFYQEADERTAGMVRNLSAAVKSAERPGERGFAVLVVGGFHTPEFTRLLADAGMSYAVVQPKISRVDGTGTEYLSIFAKEKTPLDKLFEGQKLFLAPDALLAGSPAVAAQAVTREMLSLALLAERRRGTVLPALPGVQATANEDGSITIRFPATDGLTEVRLLESNRPLPAGFQVVGTFDGGADVGEVQIIAPVTVTSLAGRIGAALGGLFTRAKRSPVVAVAFGFLASANTTAASPNRAITPENDNTTTTTGNAVPGYNEVEFEALHPTPANPIYHSVEHSRRVARAAGDVAAAIGLSKATAKLIRDAAVLHDIDPTRDAGKAARVPFTLQWMKANKAELMQRFAWSESDFGKVLVIIQRTEFPFTQVVGFDPQKPVSPQNGHPSPAYNNTSPYAVYRAMLEALPAGERAEVAAAGAILSEYADKSSFYTADFDTAVASVRGLANEIAAGRGTPVDLPTSLINTVGFLASIGSPANFALDQQLATDLGYSLSLPNRAAAFRNLPSQLANFASNLAGFRAIAAALEGKDVTNPAVVEAAIAEGRVAAEAAKAMATAARAPPAFTGALAGTFTADEFAALHPNSGGTLYHDLQHSLNVAKMAGDVARNLGMTEAQADFLSKVAILHDIDPEREGGAPARVPVTLKWLDDHRDEVLQRFGWTDRELTMAKAIIQRSEFPFGTKDGRPAYAGTSPFEIFKKLLDGMSPADRAFVINVGGVFSEFIDKASFYALPGAQATSFDSAYLALRGLVNEMKQVGAPFDDVRKLDTAKFMSEIGQPSAFNLDRQLAAEFGVPYVETSRAQALDGLPQGRIFEANLAGFRAFYANLGDKPLTEANLEAARQAGSAAAVQALNAPKYAEVLNGAYTVDELTKLHPVTGQPLYHDLQHTLNVAKMAGDVARAVGMTEAEAKLMQQIALLHDIDDTRTAGIPARVPFTLDWMEKNKGDLLTRFGWTDREFNIARAVIQRSEFPFTAASKPAVDVKVEGAHGSPRYVGTSPYAEYKKMLDAMSPADRAFVLRAGPIFSEYADKASFYSLPGTDGRPFDAAFAAVEGLANEMKAINVPLDDVRKLNTLDFMSKIGQPAGFALDWQLAKEYGTSIVLPDLATVFASLPQGRIFASNMEGFRAFYAELGDKELNRENIGRALVAGRQAAAAAFRAYRAPTASTTYRSALGTSYTAKEFRDLHPTPANPIYHSEEHSLRVADAADKVAKANGFSPALAKLFREAALLHDVDNTRDAGKPARVPFTLKWLDDNKADLVARFGWSETDLLKVKAIIQRTEFPFTAIVGFDNTRPPGPDNGHPAPAYATRSPFEFYRDLISQLPAADRADVMKAGAMLSEYADKASYYTGDFETAVESVLGLANEIGAAKNVKPDFRGSMLNTVRFLQSIGGEAAFNLDRQLAGELGVDLQIPLRDVAFANLRSEARHLNANIAGFLEAAANLQVADVDDAVALGKAVQAGRLAARAALAAETATADTTPFAAMTLPLTMTIGRFLLSPLRAFLSQKTVDTLVVLFVAPIIEAPAIPFVVVFALLHNNRSKAEAVTRVVLQFAILAASIYSGHFVAGIVGFHFVANFGGVVFGYAALTLENRDADRRRAERAADNASLPASQRAISEQLDAIEGMARNQQMQAVRQLALTLYPSAVSLSVGTSLTARSATPEVTATPNLRNERLELLAAEIAGMTSFDRAQLAAILPAMWLLANNPAATVTTLESSAVPTQADRKTPRTQVQASGARTAADARAEINAMLGANAQKGAAVAAVFAVDESMPDADVAALAAEFAGRVAITRNNASFDLSEAGLQRLTGLADVGDVTVAVSRNTRLSDGAIDTLRAFQEAATRSGRADRIQVYLLLDALTRAAIAVPMAQLADLAKFQRLIATQA